MNQPALLGGYEGLYVSYYKKIKDEVEIIKNENDYDRTSHAFAHWFLVNIKGLDEDEVSGYITDGYNDWSIDAVIINNEKDLVELYQFKLPDKEKNIHDKIGQDEISKFLMGYKFCSSGKPPENANDKLKEMINEIVESEIYSFQLTYVSYTDNLSEHGQIVLEDQLKRIQDTGNRISWTLYDKESLTNSIYINRRKHEDYTVELIQAGSSTGILTSENAASYTIHCSIAELADVCEKYEDVIFDENVRLFHGINNKFNTGIIKTATSEEVVNFHLYSNGIVMVSPEVKYIDTRKKLKISNPMVVNGCQTMNSLVEAKKAGCIQEGYVQVKVIEIKDPVVRKNISIYLNSQTEIKDSYLISNLPVIRQLEEDLGNLGYVLERQANKIDLLKRLLSRKEAIEKLGVNQSKAISLELAIQLYATFFESLAPVAKLNKAKLFNEDNLQVIFEHLNAERVLFSYKIYTKIMDIIRDYRRCNRNRKKNVILKYLGIKSKDLRNYSFLNTADIFLLSLFSRLSQVKVCYFNKVGKSGISDFNEWYKKAEEAFDETIKESISIIKETLEEDTTGKTFATLTKSQAFHKKLMQKVLIKYS